MKQLKLFFLLFALMLTVSANAVIQEGSCGDNVTFVLNDDGTLVISGTGAMMNYASATSVHWYSNRSKIIKATIEDGVTSIGNYAFYKCSGLTSVTIPNSVASIGNYAFHGCSGLTSVNIPNSVTSIGEQAFANCTSLPVENGLRYAGTFLVGVVNKDFTSYTIKDRTKWIGRVVFSECSSLTSVTIPNSVTSIGEQAFYKCSGLTSITIPNSVTNIESYAFAECSALREIHSNNVTPPECGSNCFRNVKTSQCKLYVPTGSKEDYQFANGWSDFVNIIEENVVTPSDGIEKPTITFKDNSIYFESNNANAKYLYTIQATDAVASLQEAENGSVPLTGTYIVTAYAKTDDGTSEAATATLNFPLEKEVEREVEVFIYDDTHANIDLPTGERVTIEIREGIVTIKSLPINSTVYVYTEGGELWETRRVNSASLTLDLPRHNVYIIKTSGKTFKVKI